MTTDAVAAPVEATTDVAPSEAATTWREIAKIGLIGGAIALYLCLVGIIPVFHSRQLIAGVITLGQVALFGSMAIPGAVAARRARTTREAVLAGGAAGLITGGALTLLVVVGSVVNLRAMFLNASPELYSMLTMGLGVAGAWIPAVEGLVLGAGAAAFGQLPDRVRSPVARGLLAVLIVGLFAGLLRAPLMSAGLFDIARLLFTGDGLTVAGAVIVFTVVVLGRIVRQRVGVAARVAALTAERREQLRLPAIAALVGIILVLPLLLGPFFAQVIALVALYILMGFGLNITLGLAGLLDLGFVAFFAVGAYTVGLFTSLAEYGLLDVPFWVALPFAMLFAAIFGAILGLPILSIRGDYLAIATLGFGEIIRILAGSNLLLPLLGGPRGIINIPKPVEVSSTSFLAGPVQIYYIALIFAAVVAFVALRLRSGRIGRAWVAIREDEDVAEAVGVNLIQTKLLAYILGAAFAGLGGAIFAGLVGSIFPSSINLFVSINVAAIVIVGGMGSIPGVVLGALFLIGIPELFRELQDYRFLFYGFALIGMMLYRPEGLWPSGIARRELHVGDEAPAMIAGDTTPITRGTMS
jgi:branched-chain amino acid transport system permease protein